MFSGIIEEVGTLLSIKDSGEGRTLRISATHLLNDMKLGDSISVSGCCLTVIEFDSQCFVAEAVHETLRRTKLGALVVGSKVNLERALKFNDRMGGHLVTGHVDTVGRVKEIKEEGFSKVITFELSAEWSPFFVEKGSVALDGVSLTVAGCDPLPTIEDGFAGSLPPFTFFVALIPWTMDVTTFGALKVGDPINIETDIIARYVARWLSPSMTQMVKLASSPLGKLLERESKSSVSDYAGPIQLLQ